MKMLPNEGVIPTMIEGITLTNLRLRYKTKKEIFSALITEVSCIELERSEQKWMLYVCIISALLGGRFFMTGNDMFALIGGAVALVFFVLYWDGRQLKLAVNSKGAGGFKIPFRGFADNEIMDLIEKVEHAKNDHQMYFRMVA